MYYYYLLLTELVVAAAAGTATGSAFSTPQLDGQTVVKMIGY